MPLINILDGVTSLSDWVGKKIRLVPGVVPVYIPKAVGHISSVSGMAPNEVVTLEDPGIAFPHPFEANDIIMIQQVDLSAATVVVVKRIFRKVESVASNVMTMAALAGARADTGVIAKGDTMVVLGSTKEENTNPCPYRAPSILDQHPANPL